MIWRQILRYPKGSENELHPHAGWWLDLFDPNDPTAERAFGPFDTMQEAADFRDAGAFERQ